MSRFSLLALLVCLLPAVAFAGKCPVMLKFGFELGPSVEVANWFKYSSFHTEGLDNPVAAANVAIEAIHPGSRVPEDVQSFSELDLVLLASGRTRSGKCQYRVVRAKQRAASYSLTELGLVTELPSAERSSFSGAEALLHLESERLGFSLMMRASPNEPENSIYDSQGGVRERGYKHDPSVFSESSLDPNRFDTEQIIQVYEWRRSSRAQISGQLNESHQWTAFLEAKVTLFSAAAAELYWRDLAQEAWSASQDAMYRLTGLRLEGDALFDFDLVARSEAADRDSYLLLRSYGSSTPHLRLWAGLIEESSRSLAEGSRSIDSMSVFKAFAFVQDCRKLEQKIASWSETAGLNLERLGN